jgi:heme/copper-type cytochrome/quinol oxidase subunit 1
MWMKIAEKNKNTRHRWIVTTDHKDIGLRNMMLGLEANLSRAYNESARMLRHARREADEGYFVMAQRKVGPDHFELVVQEII